MTGFFLGGKSNYTQQKVLWNSISDSAGVAFQHILIWAHQRQHVISHNQLCLGVVKVGVWYDTSLCLGSNASNSVMILHSGPSCCNVTQHSALHLSLFYIKQYITTLPQWATTHIHTQSELMPHSSNLDRSPPNRIWNLGPVCPFLLLFSCVWLCTLVGDSAVTGALSLVSLSLPLSRLIRDDSGSWPWFLAESQQYTQGEMERKRERENESTWGSALPFPSSYRTDEKTQKVFDYTELMPDEYTCDSLVVLFQGLEQKILLFIFWNLTSQ